MISCQQCVTNKNVKFWFLILFEITQKSTQADVYFGDFLVPEISNYKSPLSMSVLHKERMTCKIGE